MRQVTKLAMLLFTFVTLFAGCKEDKPKDLIVKKWGITDAKIEGEEKVPEERMKIMKSLVMEFTKDGKLIVTGLPDGPQTGSYSMSEDGKTLTTTDPRGNSTVNNVTTLTKTKLVFKDPKGGFTFSAESK